ncbi:MAG: TonB-dependent receptor [Deltaproteobacteria bacterium]|nr:TonB-dependent receptor [Deltaproteobacteria bacterium]
MFLRRSDTLIRAAFVDAVIILVGMALIGVGLGTANGGSRTEGIDDLIGETKVMFIGEHLHMVSAASGFLEPTEKAPAAVTVIGRKEIEQSGLKTLAEVLERVPGFFVEQDERKNRIYLRGIPDSFLVIMDGVPFANDTSAKNYPRGYDLSLATIEKIEIVRGPGSALWGANAFSGVINLVTRNGANLNGTEVSVMAGPQATRLTSVTSGYKEKNVDLFISGSYNSTEGFPQSATGNSDDVFREFYMKMKLGDHLEMSGRFSSVENHFNDRGIIFFPIVYSGVRQTPFSFFQTQYTNDLGPAQLTVRGFAEYFENKEQTDYYLLHQDNSQYGTEARLDITSLDRNIASLGLTYKHNRGSDTTFDLSLPNFPVFRGVSLYPGFDSDLFSIYMQDKYQPVKDIELTGGVRFDKHSKFDGVFNPRLGLSWQIGAGFHFKALYGRSFRTPALTVYTYDSNVTPERLESFDLELGYTKTDVFSVRINPFYYDVEQLYESPDSLVRENVSVKGTELSLNYWPWKKVELFTNISLLDDGGLKAHPPWSTGTPLYYYIEENVNLVPGGLANFGVKARLTSQLTGELRWLYVGRRDIPSYIVSNDHDLAPYLKGDLAITSESLGMKNLKTGIYLNNILNTSYETRGYRSLVPGRDRELYIKVSYLFD